MFINLYKKFRKELFGSFVFAFLIVFIEIFLRKIHNITVFDYISAFFITFVFAIFLLCVHSRILAIFLGLFLSFGYFSEFSNLIYFGYWLYPMDIWLAFSKFNDVLDASLSVITYNKLSFVLCLTACFLPIMLVFLRKNTKKSKVITIFAIILLLLYPVKIFFKDSTIGRKIKLNHGVTKSFLYTSSNFIAKIVPEQILNLSSVSPSSRIVPNKKFEPIVDNIILIVGESLSASYVSALGYDKNTTPFLSKQKNNPNSIVKKVYSSGLFTDISVPFLLNLARKPDATQQIYSLNTNLFKFSKEQDFKSFFFTAQAGSNLNFIPLIGGKYIDVTKSSYDFTKDLNKEIDDKYLISFFLKKEFAKKNFIVLQQNGSHEPYNKRYPKRFNFFGNDSLKKHYLNSIRYTDFINNEIVEKVKSTFDNYVVIYTSDHGQHVTELSAGKGSYDYSSNYEVPLLITSNSKNALGLAHEIFDSCETAFHVQVGEYIAMLMGYDIASSNCRDGFVAPKTFTGNNGYLYIKQNNGKVTTKILYN